MKNLLNQARSDRNVSPKKAIATLDKINRSMISDERTLIDVFKEYFINYTELGMIDKIDKMTEELKPLITEGSEIEGYYNKVCGVIHVERGEFTLAIENFKKVIDYAKKCGDKRILYNETINMGVLFHNLRRPEKALHFLEEARDMADENGFPRENLLLNLCTLYGLTDNVDKSIEAGLECEKFLLKSNNKVKLATCYNNLGNAYHYKKDYDTSIKYLELSMTAAEEADVKNRFTDATYMIAQNLMKKEEYKLALNYLNTAFDIESKTDHKPKISKLYYAFSSVYAKIGDYEKAFDNLKKYNDIKEKILDDSTQQNIARYEAQYKIEQKMHENEQMLMLYARQAEMGQMISAIAHQWKQPINALSIILDSIYDAWEFDELDEESLRRKISSGRELIFSMSKTVEDFRSFFQKNQSENVFNIREVIEKAARFTEYRFRHQNIELEYKIKDNKLLNGSSNQLLQVLLIILNNAYDALSEKKINAPFVSIWEKVEDDNIVIRIADNGGGISEKAKQHLFKSHFSTKMNSEGSGIGLYIARMIVEYKFNGTISAQNKNNGAVFTIKLPLNNE